MLRILPVFAVFFALGSCGTSSLLPAGAACTATTDCDVDLQCLDLAQFSGTTCTVVGKQCTIVCTDDPSCATLGANFKCFQGCATDKTCGATQ
jgi:hypothetical protein